MRETGHLFSYRERFWLLRRIFAAEITAGSVILSVRERTLPKPNYTIHTLAALSAICGRKPVVVIGADQAQNIARWHRADELMHEYDFIVFARSNIPVSGEPAFHHEVVADFAEPLSATQLRAALSALPAEERLNRALRFLTEQK